MTEQEAEIANVYEDRMRAHMATVHAVLYIARDEWIENGVSSVYEELVEASMPLHRPQLPIINVVPRGADRESLRHPFPGVATVGWRSRSVIRAVRKHAIPAFPGELRLRPGEAVERTRIVAALQANVGSVEAAARSLGVSVSTLRRKRLAYVIL
jgi:transcriptional regulator of acetoin/glycerol metabolism